MLVKLASDT